MAERPDYNDHDRGDKAIEEDESSLLNTKSNDSSYEVGPNDLGSENSKVDSSKDALDADKKHGLDKKEENAPKQ